MKTIRMYGVMNRNPEPTPFDSSDWPEVFSPEEVAAVLERLDRMNTPSARATAERIRRTRNS